jgi:hypothetical protein
MEIHPCVGAQYKLHHLKMRYLNLLHNSFKHWKSLPRPIIGWNDGEMNRILQEVFKAFFILSLFALLGLTTYCASDENLEGVDEVVRQEIERLGFETTGEATVQTVDLPSQLDDANWGLKAMVCQEGGYDLYFYAGETVTLTSVDITETCQGEALRLWVVSKDEDIICVYKTVREGSGAAPGVWSVYDKDCS